MPDLDIVEREIKSPWRKPYRLLKGGHPVEFVADALIKTATAQIRLDGGVPGFPELARALQTSSVSTTSGTLAAAARNIEHQFDHYRPVKILSRVCLRQQAHIDEGKTLPCVKDLASDYCWELMRHHLLSRIEPTLIGNGRRFEDLNSYHRYCKELRSNLDPQLRQLATKIVANPENRNIRAPAHRRPRPSVEACVKENLVGLYSRYCREWAAFPARPSAWASAA